MFRQEIKTGKEAQKALLAGVTALVDVIGRTLGPRSRCVALTAPGNLPLVVNDGVTIARQIMLPDPFEAVGAELVKEASIRTAEIAGDGTTTSALLALQIFRLGAEEIFGHSLVELKRGMDAAVAEITERLEAWAKPVPLEEGSTLDQICTVSANNDAALGALIADAFRKVGGKDGIVAVEASNDTESKVIVSEGFRFDKGWLSRAFVQPGREEILMEEALVLVAEREFSDHREILRFVEKFTKEKPNQPLLWVVNGMNSLALNFLVQNNMLGRVKMAVVEAPFAGVQRREFMEDLALYTGAKFLSSQSGFKMDNVDPNKLGRVARITIRANETALIHDEFQDLDEVKARLKLLREKLADGPALSEADASFLVKRVSWLSAKAARVSLTFVSVAEMKEKMARVDDAIRAAQAALAEGYLPGGCLPFLHLGWEFETEKKGLEKPTGFTLGRRLVYLALAYPFDILLNNMGYDASFKEEVLMSLEAANGAAFVLGSPNASFPSVGFDALEGRCGNLIEAGIIDPLKVVRLALKNSVSVAYTLLSMDAVVVNIPDNKFGG